MDSIQKIAISHLADLFSTQKIIFAKRDFWKRIFYNSGQSELYEDYKPKLSEKCREENWTENWSFNDGTYTALLEIFNELYNNHNNEFIGLLKIIVNEIYVSRIFIENVEKKIQGGYSS